MVRKIFLHTNYHRIKPWIQNLLGRENGKKTRIRTNGEHNPAFLYYERNTAYKHIIYGLNIFPK
jgi:hypothetical protein